MKNELSGTAGSHDGALAAVSNLVVRFRWFLHDSLRSRKLGISACESEGDHLTTLCADLARKRSFWNHGQ